MFCSHSSFISDFTYSISSISIIIIDNARMNSNSSEEPHLRLQAIRARNEQRQPNQRRQVLSEEVYTANLSRIIQRDFYPSLTNLQEQSALLSRRNSYHPDILANKLNQLHRQREREEREKAKQEETQIELYQDCATNERSESTELVVIDKESGQLVRTTARPLHEETLTGFHARVTNEDDFEFDEKQKEEVVANRQRLELLFRLGPNADSTKLLTAVDSATKNNFVNVARIEEQKRIQAAKDESDMASDQFEIESYQPMNPLVPPVRDPLFSPPTPQVLGPSTDSRQTSSHNFLTNVESDKNQTSNKTLQLSMPPPLPVQKDETNDTSKGSVQSSLPKTSLVEYIPKYCQEKKIVPSQTRFPPPRIIPSSNVDQPRRLFGQTTSSFSRSPSHARDLDSDGWTTDTSTDLDAPLRPVELERQKQQSKRAREQRSFVNMTPIIEPGSGRHRSPITTWGTVAFTPIVVSGSEHIEPQEDSITSEYKMAEENDREVAARKAEKELERRAKHAKSRSNKNHRTSNGNSTLSNAASRLLASKSGSSSRQRSAFASALRGSYTPKRLSSSKRRLHGSLSRDSNKRSRSRDHAQNATPVASRLVK